ncbi:MAG: hypothetical protein IPN71_08760 [Fibrobacteres bacterium]|nr:hypothetical protein [Fibrobacterota bacterium]
MFDTTWNAAIIYGWPEDGRDTTVYRSVKVGSQIWLAQNLAYAGTDGKLGVCQGSEDSCARYGRLYKWTEMMDLGRAFDTTLWSGEVAAHRGICPAGWHVPAPRNGPACRPRWIRTTATMATDSNRRFSGKAPATARTSTGFARFLAVVGTGEAWKVAPSWGTGGAGRKPSGLPPSFSRCTVTTRTPCSRASTSSPNSRCVV